MKKFLALFLAIIMLLPLTACGKKKEKETFDWTLLELHDMLPQPTSNFGQVYCDDEEELRLSVEEITKEDYKAYLSACKKQGFTVDAENSSGNYEAYNDSGFLLRLTFYASMEEFNIELTAPMKMSALSWPTIGPGSLLPKPESNMGNVTNDSKHCFAAYIADTTKDQFEAYINKCIKAGFDVDYNKGDNFFNADNEEGCHLRLDYEGNNIMFIRIDAPDDETPEPVHTSEPEENTPEPVEEMEEPEDTEEPEITEKPDEEPDEELVDGMRPRIKKAIDEYEDFIDEYCKFMRKYYDSGEPISMLVDYTEMLNQLIEAEEAFVAISDEELNDAETMYYLKVMNRVSEKLLELDEYISEHSGNN